MKLLKLKSKLKIFDYLIILVFLSIGFAFLFFFFRRSQFLTVTVKVTEQDVLYASNSPPSWFSFLFTKGMKSKDGLGRSVAELTDVYLFDSFNEKTAKKVAYLTLKLKTTYNTRTKEHKFRGTSLVVGEGLRFQLEKILIQGLIVDIEGIQNPFEETHVIVDVMLQNDPRLAFLETTGVDEFITNAVSVGDKVQDSKSNSLAEVLEKKVFPATKNTFDDRGNVYQRQDPRMKDMYLKLRVKVKQVNNELYYLDEIRVNIGSILPLHFKNITIWPTVTNIYSN